MAANRCITPWTVVETAPRPRRCAELIGERHFYVHSWADESECVAQASGVFLKGIEPAFRLLLDSGEWFDCSRRHRVLTGEGWLSLDQLIRRASGLRWTQTIESYLANCGEGVHQHDRQFRMVVGSDLGSLPLRDDVRRDSLLFSRRDAAERIRAHSRVSPTVDRYSTLDEPNQIDDLCGMFEDPAPCIDALRRTSRHQDLLRLASASALLTREHEGASRLSFWELCEGERISVHDVEHNLGGQAVSLQADGRSAEPFDLAKSIRRSENASPRIEIFYPSAHPELTGGRRVLAVVPLGYQPILDFTVEKTACYRAAGVIHHNTGKTLSAAAEVSYHATGDYPEWWKGKRFDRGILIWTGSPTNETSRDIVQKELLGGLGEELGTGWIPKARLVGPPATRQAGVKNVVDSFKVRHRSGTLSTCVMKTYEQGWTKWQGTAPHVIWLDEEPEDEKIFFESETRILTSSGILMVTFTPLRGQTPLVDHFQEGKRGTFLIGATWDDAPHLNKEDKESLIERYPDYIRDARTKGIPMLGEGAVFPVPEERIRIDPFRIPDHWARIKGVDFGIDHPAAGVELVWDRDLDIIYVIDGYKEKGQTAAYHAAWLNKSNKRVPVAWPHDGMNREKSGGKTLADSYRAHGVNMLSKSARYPRVPGEASDKGGPQPIEPIVDEVLERMLTGRFFVFSSVVPFFEEFRSYHRKDGRIMDRRDDILKATFYAVMMRRYAMPLSSFSMSFSSAPTQPIATSSVH